MYRLLIAEDEYSTRKWLSRKIQWEELGIELVAVVDNGADALSRLLEDRAIDVVMTDIRMPFMDGIELLQKIRENGLSTEIVILSGFGEFEYAQQALQQGVRDYLLKPITQEQITEVFIKLVNRLNEKQLSSSQSLLANQLKNEQTRRAKAELLGGWLAHKKKYEPIERHLSYLGVTIPEPPYLIVVAEIDDYLLYNETYSVEDQKLCIAMASNIMEEIASHHGCVEAFFLEPKRFVFWFQYDSEAGDPGTFVKELGTQFQEMIRKYIKVFKITVTVGAGNPADTLEGLRDSFDQAVKAVESKFYHGISNIYTFCDAVSEHKDVPFPVELEKRLISSLKQNDMESAFQDLDEWFGHLAENVEKETILLLVSELLFQLLKQLGELRSLPVPSDKMASYANMLAPIETFGEMKQLVKELIMDITRTMGQEAVSRNPIAQAIEYLKLNLHRDISLQSIAEYVGVSPSYFSTIFKKSQGESFIDFLVRLRLEKSLGMLETTRLSVAQIGEEIGYHSYRYFIKVFKDQYGITPTQYRERLEVK